VHHGLYWGTTPASVHCCKAIWICM
jgi:hypothetical protein